MPTGLQRECITCSDLEQACLAEAGRRSTQANHTPCFQSPLWEIFGKIGVNQKEFDQVLVGNFEPTQSCDPFTKKVLAHLKRPVTVRPTKAPELDEYIYGWKRAWEETSSSHSNVHFGHYIAGSQDERIAQFNAGMAAILAATGYSPN